MTRMTPDELRDVATRIYDRDVQRSTARGDDEHADRMRGVAEHLRSLATEREQGR